MSGRLLSIDPGTFDSAYCIWDGKNVLRHEKISNGTLLMLIRSQSLGVVERMVIEQIAHYGTGMPSGQTVYDTCVWIGRFIEAYETATHGRYDLVPRSRVKLHICNSMKAKDSNIRQALIDKLGPVGTRAKPGPTYGLKADEWQALALAVTFWEQECRPHVKDI